MATFTRRPIGVRTATFVLTALVATVANEHSHARSDVGTSSVTPSSRDPGPGAVPIDNRFRLGPIEGLTTSWYPAPPDLSLPSVSSVLLHYSIAPDIVVSWNGGTEIWRDEWGSTAVCPLMEQIPQSIEVHLVDPSGPEWTADCRVNALGVPVAAIEVGTPHVWVDTIEIDENLPEEELNQITMQYFFRESSIAGLTDLGNGRYRTSVVRDIYVDVAVTPPELSRLIEWRIDGNAWRLGAASVLRIDEIGDFRIEAGPLAAASSFELQTYSTIITSHVSNSDLVDEAVPTVFTAVTDPPGYEAEITWLSSTLYGSGRPILGSGPVFVVEFNDTLGPDPDDPDGEWQWLGVRADHGFFNQDRKVCGPDCVLAGEPGEEERRVPGRRHLRGAQTSCAFAHRPRHVDRGLYRLAHR